MPTLGNLEVNLRAETAAFRQSMDRGSLSVRGMERSFKSVEKAARTADRAFNNIGRLSAPLAVLEGSVGRTAGAVAGLGASLSSIAGAGVLGLVVAGVTAVAFAYDVLTKKSREAAKATREFGEAQVKAFRERTQPGFEIREGVTGLRRRQADIERAIADEEARLARRRAANALPFGASAFEARIAKLKADLAPVVQAIAAAQANLQAITTGRGNELVQSLAFRAGTFGMAPEDAEKLAVALESSLTPAQRRAATATLEYIKRLRLQREEQEKATAATKRAAEETDRHVARVREQLGVTDERGRFEPGEQRFASRPRSTVVPFAQNMELLRRNIEAGVKPVDAMIAAAKRTEQVWQEAASGIGSAFADLFTNLHRGGEALLRFMENVALSIANAFARLLGEQITGALLQSVFPRTAPTAFARGESLPTDFAGPSPRAASTRMAGDTFFIHIENNASALDARGIDQVFAEREAQLTASVVRGISKSTAARRGIRGR